MQYFIRATALLFVVALFAIHDTTVHAAPEEGDWASGWNTWKTAAEGDWIQYSISGIVGSRQEVTKVAGDNVTYTHKTLDKDGNVTSSNEFTRRWDKIKVQSKLPYGDDMLVTWTEVEVEIGGKKVTCDVASWNQGKGADAAATEVYYSKDVPCGGIVKTVTNGNAIAWVTAFKKAGGDAIKEGPKEEVKSELPRFFATVDNKAVVKVSAAGRDDSYQLRTVTSVAETSSKWTVIACDKEGTPDSKGRLLDFEQTKEAWDEDYGKPAETGVTVKVEAGEFVCDLFKSSASGREISEWISEGLSVKKVIKAGGKETTIELVSYTMK